MKYLVGELGELTGIRPPTIRKWQERFGVFTPIKGENGYHYYTSEDYMILLNIKHLLENGKKIRDIMKLGREELFHLNFQSQFSDSEKKVLNLIEIGRFEKLEEQLDEANHQMTFLDFIHKYIPNILHLVGYAWEKRVLSVAEEHSFTKWLHSYLYQKSVKKIRLEKPIWLVTVFPDDQHEIGALLHFADLMYKKIPAKYVGALPLEFIMEELKENSYRTVSLSMTLKQKKSKIEKVKEQILKNTSVKKVLLGGRGYRLSK
ncbi:MAG: MerR family transcriptional regulator [Leptospiraceae bacterium]|nr:MerR family transcriptional regulator [Leptospiraceae bacterium]MCP5495059.1 MerR family transcriptional regulator [Leptospiraceae bacterium]